MNDQVIRFAVISFSGIIGIAVAQLVFGGGLDPIRLLALAAVVVSLALVTLALKRALARPAAPKTPPPTALEQTSPCQSQNHRHAN